MWRKNHEKWEEIEVGIKSSGSNINILACTDDAALLAGNEDLRYPLLKWKKTVQKPVYCSILKQPTTIMSTSEVKPVQISGERVEVLRNS